MDLRTGTLNIRPARSEPGPHHVIAWRTVERQGRLDTHLGAPDVAADAPSADVVWSTILGGASVSTEVLTVDGWKDAASDRYAGPPLRAADLSWDEASSAATSPGSSDQIELRAARSVARRRFALGVDRWLDALLFDVGDAIAFGEAIVATADPFSTRLAGQTIESRFLSLDMAHPDELAQFFNVFGAPPDLGYPGHAPWSGQGWSAADGRWISLARLRQLQGAFDAFLRLGRLPGADERFGRDAHGRWRRPAYGDVRSDGRGRPLWHFDLWEAIGVALAADLDQGEIGFCEAPLGRGMATRRCGRPFVASREGRRMYCSERCHTRAGTRAYKLALKARKTGQAATGITPSDAAQLEV